MKYNPNFFNKGVFPRFTGVSVYSQPSYSSELLYTVNGFVGMSDGMFETVDGWTWYRLAAIDGVHVWGWVREDYVELKSVNPAEYNTAQARLNLIIENDMNSLTYLLIGAEYCRRLEAKGYNVTSYKKKIRNLYNEIIDRNEYLKDSGLVENVKEGQSTLTQFAPALLSIVNNTAFVGVVISTTALVTLIVSAVVISVGATIYYFSNEARLEESKYTYKESKELTSVLENVDPEIAQSIRNDIGRQVQEAEAQGHTNGYWKGAFNLNFFSILKYGAIAVGAIWVVKWIKNNF